MLSIGFTGDVSFSGFFEEKIRKEEHIFSENIVRWFAANNYNVLNIEGPITGEQFIGKNYGPSLANNPICLPIIRKLKGNIFALANNHMMDAGTGGLIETIRLANDNNIVWFGAGNDLDEASRPLIIEIDNIKVGLLGISQAVGQIAGDKSAGIFGDYLEELLQKTITELKKTCDWIVLVYHGGEEFTFIPMPNRRKRLLKYLDFGVDIIVAHHSHTVQAYESFDGKRIFYSLGNFVFDTQSQYMIDGTTDSVLLRLKFDKKKFFFEYIFTQIDREKKVVNQIYNNDNFFELNPNDYRDLWLKDATRRLFYKFIPNKADQPAGFTLTEYSLLAKLTKMFLNPLTYRNIIVFLREPNYRPILLAACEHLIRQRLSFLRG